MNSQTTTEIKDAQNRLHLLRKMRHELGASRAALDSAFSRLKQEPSSERAISLYEMGIQKLTEILDALDQELGQEGLEK